MLYLGGIEFTDFELPDKIDQGGSQELVVHKTIGGQRVIDAMGPDDGAIEWTGTLLGETAQLRALRLDLLRRSGREVDLEFGLRAYRCVVRHFRAEMQRPYLLSYSISVEIIEDLVAGTGGEDSRTIEAQVEEDLIQAEILAEQRLALMAGIETLRGLMSGRVTPGTLLRSVGMVAIAEFQSAAGMAVEQSVGEALIADAIVGSVSSAVAPSILGATGGLVTSGAAAGMTSGRSEAQMAVPGSFAGVSAGGSAPVMAAGLTTTASAANDGYAAHRVAAHMTRVQTNLSEVPP